VYENKVLRRTFEPKTEEITGQRKLHNEEPHNLCSSEVIRVIKSRKVRGAGHLTCMK
jgi:hypothetical protein